VRFDHGHFSQVMWNLCRNALRHCQRREGSIRIAVAAPARDNRVRLDVCDDGPGVPPQLRGQLFEPFFTTDAGAPGWACTRARDLPGERRDPRVRRQRQRRAVHDRLSGGMMQKGRVLVVDDEADIRELLAMTLQRMGLDATAPRASAMR